MTPLLYAKLGAGIALIAAIFFGGYHLGGLGPKAALATDHEAMAKAASDALIAEQSHEKTETDRLNGVIATYEQAALTPVDPTIAHRVLSKYTLGQCAVPSAPANSSGTVPTSAVPASIESALESYISACAQDALRLNALQQAWPK